MLSKRPFLSIQWLNVTDSPCGQLRKTEDPCVNLYFQCPNPCGLYTVLSESQSVLLFSEEKKLSTVYKSTGTDCESDSMVYKPSTWTLRRKHSIVTQALLLNLKEAFSWPPIRLDIKQLRDCPRNLRESHWEFKKISKDVLRHPRMNWIPWLNWVFFFTSGNTMRQSWTNCFYKMSIKW